MTKQLDVYHTPILNLDTGVVFEDAKAVETWLRKEGILSAQRGMVANGALANHSNTDKVYRRYGYPWVFQVS